MGEPLVAGVGTPLQFVFDRTASAGLEHGQCLAVSLSAADEWLGLPADELIAMAERELARLFPAAARAERIDGVVTREHAATFRGGPGTQPSAPASPRTSRTCTWPEPGPTPVGPPRWKGPCGAATLLRAPCSRDRTPTPRSQEVLA